MILRSTHMHNQRAAELKRLNARIANLEEALVLQRQEQFKLKTQFKSTNTQV